MAQLEVVSRRLLANLTAATPVLTDAAVMAHLDIDSCQRRVYGHAKQGAGFGAAKVGGYTLRLRGLNPLLAAVSTPGVWGFGRRDLESDGVSVRCMNRLERLVVYWPPVRPESSYSTGAQVGWGVGSVRRCGAR